MVLAALALPGVWQAPAHAQAPEKGVIAIKHLHYQESQPGLKRITVNSPSVYLLAPVGGDWALEGSLVVDSLSGATPRWQTAVSSASVQRERRTAGDVKVTRYFERSSYSVGVSHSTENDYVSTAVSLGGSWSTADNNTTWNIGVGSSDDVIKPTSGAVNNPPGTQRKRSTEMLVGLTQVLSKNDIVQANFTFTTGEGFYSDPYKLLDERPEARKQAAGLLRWNHHFEDDGSTLRSGYRYYRDSYGIKAHQLQFEWAKPLGDSFMVSPSVRYYTQNAARFYIDPVLDANGQIVIPTTAPAGLKSGDQRLSSFGAVTVGLKADYKLTPDFSVDGKLEAYEQRGDWQGSGKGTKGLDPFKATFVQFGARYRF
ncbi:MAG: hypothetical protein AD742_03805 [Methylibium sp. NZG]|nr:MAG: hypothetical protein AD742_03805 [Methylibium sp. NZG]